jgi:hypothetical protein
MLGMFMSGGRQLLTLAANTEAIMGSKREMDFIAAVEPTTSPDAKWTVWALWSVITLVVALFAVFVAGADTGLLLGWVVGVIVAAMLMVFSRK